MTGQHNPTPGPYRFSLASDEAEKEEVYAFRYAWYYRDIPCAPGVDRRRKRVFSPHDAVSVHILARDARGDLLAVGAGTRADVDNLPDYWPALFDFARLSAFGLDKVLVYSRLVEHPSCRGGSLFLEFFKYCARLFTSRGFLLTVHYCAPAVVGLYERLGYRCYSNPTTFREGLFRIPMVLNTLDRGHLQKAHPAFLNMTRDILPAGNEEASRLIWSATVKPPLCLQEPLERLEHVRGLAPEGTRIPDKAASLLRKASLIAVSPEYAPELYRREPAAPESSASQERPPLPPADPPLLWFVLDGRCLVEDHASRREDAGPGVFINGQACRRIACLEEGVLLLLGPCSAFHLANIDQPALLPGDFWHSLGRSVRGEAL
ncbi:MAG: hypothetical protein LBR31_00015 [Desulfovibrio sp.]|jgi:hypothetical protein|nr:hypothetical protein [Desulfovibrio sp.]